MDNQHRSGSFDIKHGIDFQSIGNYRRAFQYLKKHLITAKENGDRDRRGGAYGNLGNVYQLLGEYRKAIEYHEKHLKITTQIDDRGGEGRAYGNLGIAYRSICLLYTSPSPRDLSTSRMPSSA